MVIYAFIRLTGTRLYEWKPFAEYTCLENL